MAQAPVLVVAAHPDDEVLGCGGTIARLSAEGREVIIAIFGEGLTSRQADRKDANPVEVDALRAKAKDVADLHSANNSLTKQTALSEKGDVINGRGDTPNRHDVLTGSQGDGTAFPPDADRTCKNWTSSTQGAAMLGHSDRIGLRDDDASKSWNSSHPSRGPDGGCSQADLKSTGGDGLLYCFAAN